MMAGAGLRRAFAASGEVLGFRGCGSGGGGGAVWGVMDGEA